MLNLSISQYVQLGFLLLAVIAIVINFTLKILKKRAVKQYIPIDIINSALLPHKFLYAEPKYTEDKYKAVYLIYFDSYDLETIEHQTLNTQNREYNSYTVNSASYVIIDTTINEITNEYLIVIEDNYTKAIFLIQQSAEYFYFNIKYPEVHKHRFHSRHNNIEQVRISRDELKHYRILGKVISTAKAR
jgi:hypothetical protein